MLRTARARRPLWIVVSWILIGVAPFATAKPGNGKGKNGGPGSGGDAVPLLAFSSSESQVPAGNSVLLSWASTGTRHCFASGDWEGKFPSDGSYTTPPLAAAASFSLTCKSGSNTVTGTVQVAVIPPEDPDPAPEPDPDPEPTPEPAPEPEVILSVAASSVDYGGSTRLSWSSNHASACTADGDWSGARPLTGDTSTGPLQQTATYLLTCTGDGGSASASATVTVAPAPAPSVDLQAAATVVEPGSPAQLTWSSADADGCSAGGAWSGPRPASGVETTAPLVELSTFSLSCSGPGGSAMAMLSVSVNGAVALEWQPPSENVDGTPLDDLGGYRIYYGTRSGSYTESLNIDSPTQRRHELTLPSGDYYFAMTAVDTDGNESAHSNEVLRTVD